MVFGDQEYPEETRLKVPLTSTCRREAIAGQHEAAQLTSCATMRRTHVGARVFDEYQTPILTASTP